MPHPLVCFPRYLSTCKAPGFEIRAPRLLTPWPTPPKLRLPLTQAQKRGIAVGQQAQEAQAEDGDETAQSTRHASTETPPGDARMSCERPAPQRPSSSPRHARLYTPGLTLRSRRVISRDSRSRALFELRLKGLKLSNSRTKYVSLGSHRGRVSSTYSTAWNVRYTQLVKRFNKKDDDQSQSPERPSLGVAERPIRDPWARQVAAAAAVDLDKFTKIWANLDWARKRSTWPLVMHWALSHYPERALAILSTTLMKPDYRPPPFAVADSLDYLACVFLQDGSRPDPNVVQRIRRIVSFHLEWCKGQTANFRGVSQRTLYLLIKHCRGHEQLRLYQTIRACNTFVHTNTLLHLMSSFIDIGELVTAMDILQRIVKSGANLKLDQVQQGCAKLLRGGSDLPLHGASYLRDRQHIKFQIRSNMLAQILEMGIPPNLMMYNVIILNAVEVGKLGLAWRIYAMLRANKLEPDSSTYSILLKGIRHGMDENQVFELFQRAKDVGLLSQSPYLVCQLLHITYLYRSDHEDFLPFTELLPVYEQYVDNRPLKDLGLLRHSTDTQPEPQVELMQPTGPILGMMIAAYLMQHRSSDHLPALYARYHELIEAGHPLIAPLAETDYTANAFVKVLGIRRESLPLCTTVLEHMLKAPASGSPTTKRAAPTVQTWSILLLAFMDHGQMTAGEKILTMMRDRGMEPNQVTWNTLLGGYAGMQDVEGSIKVMRRMEEAGYVVQQETLEAWGRLVDRKKLLRAFERAVKEEEQASSKLEPVDDVDE